MGFGYYMDENATRNTIEIPDGAIDLTATINSSKTIALLEKQHAEQCRQNKRIYITTVVATCAAIAAVIISIIK